MKIVTGGYIWGDPILRRLYLDDELSPIIIQTGRFKDSGSLKDFQQPILTAPLSFRDGRLVYDGPNLKRVELVPVGSPAERALSPPDVRPDPAGARTGPAS